MLDRHAKSLEEAFFAKSNSELMAKLQADMSREELRQSSCIHDDRLLDILVELGVSAESITAMTLAPMVLVAWADGKMVPEERKAILDAANENGITSDSAAGELLESWLNEKPNPSLADVWSTYITTVCGKLQAGDSVDLQSQTLGRCRSVAEAAGGFLGLGSISKPELEMIEKLEKAFDSEL